MSERKLATITEVATVFPIPGADFIEGITMTTNSWECVVKKGEVQPGDKVLYLEIDSAVPAKDKRFAFLADAGCERNMNGKRVYRLKTVKRKKQISQGLALPLADFPEFANCKIGDDVTDKLGVTVYDRQPARVGRFGFSIGRSAGKFPGFIKKTDQERIQSMSKSLLERIKDHPFEITVKMDGTSCTMYYNKDKFGVCSRNLEVRDPNICDPFFVRVWKRIKKLFGYGSRPPHYIDNSVYWDMEKQYAVHDTLTKYCKATGRNLALQGEICGPNIQSNRENLDERRYFIFDIFDIDNQRYLTSDERKKVIAEINQEKLSRSNPDVVAWLLECVPELHEVENYVQEYVLGHPGGIEAAIQNILAMTEGPGLRCKSREGLVFKSKRDGSLSFKAISNSYLLKNNL